MEPSLQKLSAQEMAAGPLLTSIPHYDVFHAGASELRTSILYKSQGDARRGKEGVAASYADTIKRGFIPKVMVDEMAVGVGKNEYKESKRVSWTNFVLHDTRSVLTLVGGTKGVCEYYRDHYPELYTEEIQSYQRQIEALTKKGTYESIRPISTIIEHDYVPLVETYKKARPLFVMPEGADSHMVSQLRKADNYVKFWPILHSSSHLLNAIAEDDKPAIMQRRTELQRMSVPLVDIFNISSLRLKPEVMQTYADTRVDGLTAVLVHNLLKNAERHSTSYVDVQIVNKNITISNDTRSIPDESKLFKPEQPQANGNTGFGLFTAKKIVGPLGGKDVVFQKVNDKVVSFTIQPIASEPQPLSEEKKEVPSTFEQQRKILADVIKEKSIKESSSSEGEALDKHIQDAWEDVIFHDTRGTVGVFGIFETLAHSFEGNVELREFVNRMNSSIAVNKEPTSTTEQKIEAAHQMVSYFRRHLLQQEFKLPPELKAAESLIAYSKTVARLWGMLHNSASLLSGVSRNDASEIKKSSQLLKETKIYTRDIVKKVRGTHVVISGLERDQQIDGAKGILLFNLLKNANRYKKTTVHVSFKGDEITVYNDSETPFNSDIFDHPGNPGAGGNTGYGMFISKNIFGLVGGYDVVVNSGTSKDIGPPFNVSFTIRPTAKSPATAI